MRKPAFRFLTRPDTNCAVVQPQKMARGLKFGIKKVEGFYYLCSENNGANQLRDCCAADLHICCRISYAKSRFSYDEAHMLVLKDAFRYGF